MVLVVVFLDIFGLFATFVACNQLLNYNWDDILHTGHI